MGVGHRMYTICLGISHKIKPTSQCTSKFTLPVPSQYSVIVTLNNIKDDNTVFCFDNTVFSLAITVYELSQYQHPSLFHSHLMQQLRKNFVLVYTLMKAHAIFCWGSSELEFKLEMKRVLSRQPSSVICCIV